MAQPITVNCQEKLNKEVIIIYYEDIKGEKPNYKSATKIRDKEKGKEDIIYSMFFNKVDNIQLIFREFDDFDEMKKNNPTLFFRINKSFLRKNRNIILTKEKLLKLGYNQSKTVLSNAKHILLIDKDEIKNRQLTIKEVSIVRSDNE